MAHPPTPAAPVKLDPLAALLSYLVPGLGQIYQGRTGKGVMFLAAVYTLFFYGMAMGQWKNVFIPDTKKYEPVFLFNRFDQNGNNVGTQLPGGVVTALWHRPQFLGQFWLGVAVWPAVLQYRAYDERKEAGPVFGKFMRPLEEDELNRLQTDGDKRWDLGWVYTVIAGMLNLLIIYDALAGPAFRPPPPKEEKPA